MRSAKAECLCAKGRRRVAVCRGRFTCAERNATAATFQGMKTQSLLCTVLFASTAFAAGLSDLRITGPYTHNNLSIYLLHRSGAAPGPKLLTLQEAMTQQKVAVYETGKVNELSIENTSSEDVYIQAGDIVKGGRQDRVLSSDLILPRHSGKLPIGAFCVEHGRWTQRGKEDSARFSTSDRALAFKDIKMAVSAESDQSKVWQEVEQAQHKLMKVGAVSAAVASPSPSSMELTLENRQLAETTDAYINALSKIVDGQSDVVGFVYAINGKINSADLYASADLFRRMWMKMLQASATEAVGERGRERSAPPDIAAVRTALAEGESGRMALRQTAGKTVVVKRESEKVLLFEARSDAGENSWIHKSWVVK
jgi:hypothetical protein